ncbi:MAG TPA: alpha-galactosidase [Lachnospiraceae bacterium]|nr:alpha-galactosidase [Lachnospiraceae bacterium]
MAIKYGKEQNTFTLHTRNTTYQMKVGKLGHLLHLYYGSKVEGDMEYLLTYFDRGFSGNPYDAELERTYSMDCLPLEYPTQGNGDYRTTCLSIRNADGTYSCDLRYKDYRITKGKYSIPGLPAIYATEEEADTLEIILEDSVSKVEVSLFYGVLEKYDVITRSVKVRNASDKAVVIEKALSASLDFLYGDYDLLTFYGRHAMERILQKAKVTHGIQAIGSKRGTSSHHYNPFLILADTQATEDNGSCYGMNLVYSGSFKAEVERDQIDQTRAVMGIQDELFSYVLERGSDFYTPEVVLSYSDSGLTKLSHNYHNIFRNNLCRGKYKLEKRPVLINNWEATYFDFNEKKIYQIAKQAAELGVEMIVLDDGWFGKRDNDLSGLGDWIVNEKKLGGSLDKLVDRINNLGLKFGIWMEPEMVSEDSDLYRNHPDYAFTIPGRKPIRSRHQLVLDFSRKEVVDHIYDMMCKVLDSANIEYLKWDMNRSIHDVYSATMDSAGQGAVLYRYMLGLYDLLERLLERYPNLLIEGCSGGGGRFDAGMLHYTPQIWCSDNTDALDRIIIQEGTSFAYPVSTVGSHVSAVPNHQTGRSTSFKTRGVVAMSGSFGYELDLGKISDEEKELVKQQIADFHKYWEVIHNGDYYRLTSSLERKQYAAWQFVSKDGKEALLNVVTLETHGNASAQYVRLKGLNPESKYKVEDSHKVYSGSALMRAGIPIPFMTNEYQAWQLHLIEVRE